MTSNSKMVENCVQKFYTHKSVGYDYNCTVEFDDNYKTIRSYDENF